MNIISTLRRKSPRSPVVISVDQDMEERELLELLEKGFLDTIVDRVKDMTITVRMMEYAENELTTEVMSMYMSMKTEATSLSVLHVICHEGEWALARWCILKLTPEAFRSQEAETGQTPLMILALRQQPELYDTQAYRNWINSAFRALDLKTLQVKDLRGWTVLHFLAVSGKNWAYESTCLTYPILLDMKNERGMSPAQLYGAQKDHVIGKLKDEANVLRKKNCELENELSKLGLGYEALQRAVQSKTATIESLREDAGRIQDDFVEIRSREVSLLAEKHTTQETMVGAVEQRESAEQAVAAARLQIEEIKAQLEDSEICRVLLERQLQRTNDAEKQRALEIQELVDQRASLETEMESLRGAEERVYELEREMQEKTAMLDAETKEDLSSQIEAELSELRTKNLKAEEERARAEQKLQEISLQKAATEEALRQAGQQKEDSAEVRRKIEDQLWENTKANESLLESKIAAEQKSATLRAKLDEAHRNESQLLLELDEERNRVDLLTKEKLALEERSEKNRNDLTEEVTVLKSRLADLRALHEESRKTEESLRKQEADRIAALQQADTRTESLAAEAMRANDLDAELARALEDIEEKQRMLEHAEASLADMRKSSTKFTLALEEHDEYAKKLKSRAEWFESDSGEARKRAEEAESRLVEARQQLEQLEKERQDWTKRDDAQATELEALRKLAVKQAERGVDFDLPRTPRAAQLARNETLLRVRGGGPVTMRGFEEDVEKPTVDPAAIMRTNAELDKYFFTSVENAIKRGDLLALKDHVARGVSLHRLTQVGLTYLEIALDEAASTKEGLDTVMESIDARLKKIEMETGQPTKDTMARIKDCEAQKERLFNQANETIGQLAPLIQYLMEQGCECDDMERFKSRRRLPGAVRLLIDNRDEHSPFCRALLKRDVGLAAQHASDVKDVNRIPTSHRKEGFSYLHLAVLAARSDKGFTPSVSFVHMLLCKELNANAKDSNGRTPLHLAMSKPMRPDHRIQVVEYLMAAGADPTISCEYEPMLEETRKALEKKGKAKKAKGTKILSVFSKTNKTSQQLQQERQTRATQFGTPFVMAQAIDDPEILERLKNMRYRRVTLRDLSDTVAVCARFHSRVSLLYATDKIKKGSILHHLIARYGDVFHGFNPDFVKINGTQKARRKLCAVACVKNDDTEAEMERKVARIISDDMSYIKMLEDYGERIGRELTAAQHLPEGTKNDFLDSCQEELLRFHRVAACLKRNPLADVLGMTSNERFKMLAEYVKDQVQQEFPERQDHVNRNRNHKYKIIEALIKFQEAAEKRRFDVEIGIQKQAEELYPAAVLAALCEFVENDDSESVKYIVTRRDNLFGGVGLDTIIKPARMYTIIDYAAHCGSIDTLSFCMSLQPERLDTVGQCNKYVSYVAAFAEQPAAVIAIDHFKHQRKLSYTEHPEIALYKIETQNNRNALHQLAFAHRADLVEFCIKQMTDKLERRDTTKDKFTPLELAQSLNMFDTEKQKKDNERIIKMFMDAMAGWPKDEASPPTTVVPKPPRYDKNIPPPTPKVEPPPPPSHLLDYDSDSDPDVLQGPPPKLVLPPVVQEEPEDGSETERARRRRRKASNLGSSSSGRRRKKSTPV